MIENIKACVIATSQLVGFTIVAFAVFTFVVDMVRNALR